MPFRRYACPNCGGGLSRTLFHPNWLSLEADKPEFQMPLVPVLLAIAALGLGLAFIHPALGVVAVLLVVYWIYWRYFAWLQCDACSRFYFGGQLGGRPRATRPWTKTELKTLALKLAVAGGALLVVFLPLKYLEQVTRQNCSTECAKLGMAGQSYFTKCKCVPKEK
ncbi:hypothetical protein [Hydrogenophaga sp.]|uniref:hypothetical protein n=1 Tax=Hydrogenophaga sp. TaxID=1904254 RepID=UPI0035B1F8F3